MHILQLDGLISPIDQLSRSGELRLLCKKAGEYAVTFPRAA